MHRSHKHHSSSFTKFVARLQHTFSSKITKSSTVIIRQQPHPCVCIQFLYRIFLKIFHIFSFRQFQIVFNYLKYFMIHYVQLNILVKLKTKMIRIHFLVLIQEILFKKINLIYHKWILVMIIVHHKNLLNYLIHQIQFDYIQQLFMISPIFKFFFLFVIVFLL